MQRAEGELDSANGVPLSRGEWDENISWEFFVSERMPQLTLCSAVCAVSTFDDRLLLVRNGRGWELPAGKIKPGENPYEAVIRETEEETGAIISNPQIFGRRKLTARTPVPNPENPDSFFPFPNSYVVFFHAAVEKITLGLPASDISEVHLADYHDVANLLSPGGKYDGIIDFLIDNGKILTPR